MQRLTKRRSLATWVVAGEPEAWRAAPEERPSSAAPEPPGDDGTEPLHAGEFRDVGRAISALRRERVRAGDDAGEPPRANGPALRGAAEQPTAADKSAPADAPAAREITRLSERIRDLEQRLARIEAAAGVAPASADRRPALFDPLPEGTLAALFPQPDEGGRGAPSEREPAPARRAGGPRRLFPQSTIRST